MRSKDRAMKVTLVYSGGLDSTTLLHDLLRSGHDVDCISFDYGQTHKKELEYATYWTKYFKLDHEIVNLQGVFAGSALTGGVELPRSEYTLESMKKTVVPNRNMVMLSIAASKAIQRRNNAVAYAAHAGDSEVYPDCRSEFIYRLHAAIQICDWHPLELLAPYMDFTKAEIMKMAKQMGYDTSKTWSCYAGGDEPCGECGACISRKGLE